MSAGTPAVNLRRMLAPLSILIATGLTFLLAGFVKGVIGLGLPTIAMGLLSLVMTPAQAASLLVVPSLLTNLWQLSGPRLLQILRRLWPMLVGICAGNWAGAGLLSGGAGGGATTALGLALIAYAAFGLGGWHVQVSARAETWLSPVIGAATGLVTAATGVFVIPAIPYLQALALDRDDFVQTFGVSATVSTLALAADLAHNGAFAASAVGTSVLALLAALAGMALGQWTRKRVRPQTFRICLFVGLLLLGGHLALRGLF